MKKILLIILTYRFADLLPAKPEQKKEETWIKKRW